MSRGSRPESESLRELFASQVIAALTDPKHATTAAQPRTGASRAVMATTAAAPAVSNNALRMTARRVELGRVADRSARTVFFR